MATDPQWLSWIRELRSIAQAGLSYSEGPYDLARYEALRSLAAEMTARLADLDLQAVHQVYVSQQGYETPKVDVRGVVFKERRVLLVQELSDGGRWTLPGGWADANDRPASAVEREVWEETGYRTHAVKLLAVYDRRYHGHQPPSLWGIYKLFFQCDVLNYEPVNSIETGASGFFAEDAIPELSLGRTTFEVLQRIFLHYDNPELPTDYD